MALVSLNATTIRPLKGAQVSQGVAGADMVIGDIVQMDGNNEAQLADMTAVGNLFMIVGVGSFHRTDGSVKTGDGITLCSRGRVALGAAVLSPTAVYFVGATAGKLDDAAGTTVRRVAGAESTQILVFEGAQ